MARAKRGTATAATAGPAPGSAAPEAPAVCVLARSATRTLDADGTEWRTCVNHPDYECSADGRVRRRDTLKVMTPDRGGTVQLSRRSLKRTVTVSHVVYEAWLNGGRPLPANVHVVYRDGDRENRAASNLIAERGESEKRCDAVSGPEWRPVVGYPRYVVSEDGRVARACTGDGCAVWHNGDGVPQVRLYGTASAQRRLQLKRAVFEAWRNGGRPLPHGARIVNLDGDAENCRADNLALASEVAEVRAAEEAASRETPDPGPTDGRHGVTPSGWTNAWDRVSRYDGTARRSTLAERIAAEERSHRCRDCLWYSAMGGGWGTCGHGPRRCTTTPDARCAAWRPPDWAALPRPTKGGGR